MSVTLPVFQPERSSVVRSAQSKNILLMSVTLAVFQPERSSEVRLEQPLNIL